MSEHIETIRDDLARALWLDGEWQKQEADPASYRHGKHVYPPKVMPKDLHALAAEVVRLNDVILALRATEAMQLQRAETAEAEVERMKRDICDLARERDRLRKALEDADAASKAWREEYDRLRGELQRLIDGAHIVYGPVVSAVGRARAALAQTKDEA